MLDHLAKPPIKNREIDVWARGIRELATFPNVFCKLSGMVTEADWQKWKLEDLVPYIDIAFETFGADRLMFGSDWPVCLTVAPYSHVVGTIKNYLSARLPAVQDAVLGGNAQRFYRLKS